MVTIDMGINTEPVDEERAAEVIERWEELGNASAAESARERLKFAKDLKAKVIETVEREGSVALDWACCGAVRFDAHAKMWAAALTQYRFEIGRFQCHVFKQ